MRVIQADKLREAVASLCVRANVTLRPDVRQALVAAVGRERSPRARRILQAIIENARLAARKKLAICQDTGMPVVFVRIGQEVRIRGNLRAAINRGVEQGYRQGALRNSIVPCPITRGTPRFSPAIIHFDIVSGAQLKITLLPKGFGAENKSQLKMFAPTASDKEITRFILETVAAAGPDACPPYVVGVGVGGTAEYASFLAKKALLENITRMNAPERQLCAEINALGIGPMGLGGNTTCLAVKIKTYPTHIAGLPVAVNISCHALRSATVRL